MPSASDIIRQITNAAEGFDPLMRMVRGLPAGGDQALRERIDYGRLNGSGPNDPQQAANQAPTSERQFYFGNPIAQTERAAEKSFFDVPTLIAIGIVLFGGWLLFKSKT